MQKRHNYIELMYQILSQKQENDMAVLLAVALVIYFAFKYCHIFSKLLRLSFFTQVKLTMHGIPQVFFNLQVVKLRFS